MKIMIRSRGVPPIRLYLPNGLFLNSVAASVCSFAAVQKGIYLSADQVMKLFRAVKSEIRSHPEWVLVDVQSRNGDRILIQL